MPGQRLLLSCVPALMLFVACSRPSNQAAPAPTPYSQTTSGNQSARRVNAIADDYWAAWVQTFPLAALFSGVPNAPNDRIGDNSIAAVRAWERRGRPRLSPHPRGEGGRPQETPAHRPHLGL